MRVLVTGGAGFIGRHVAKKLLKTGNTVDVLDNFSNSSKDNLTEFAGNPSLRIIAGDIRDKELVSKIFKKKPDMCIHLAAQVNVQRSLENPLETFDINIAGTLNLLELSRSTHTRFILVGTCLVYDLASAQKPINEQHPTLPRSPYAASKLSAEEIALSYNHAYNLPVTILRPFNTYGPFQRSDMEGGVVAIFVRRFLDGKTLQVFGDGTQTRDFLYVEDCADFIARASFSDKTAGLILNAGSGRDIRIRDLALLIAKDPSRVEHVPHHHPQSEIPKLVCDYNLARRILNWAPSTPLEEGLKRTEEWFKASVALG